MYVCMYVQKYRSTAQIQFVVSPALCCVYLDFLSFFRKDPSSQANPTRTPPRIEVYSTTPPGALSDHQPPESPTSV